MSNKSIFTESTLKLKTKVYIFSGLSLFIGLTKVLPTKLTFIGLNLEHNNKLLGWFLFIITLYFFIYFILMAGLDIFKFFKKHIINKKAKNFTGDTIGLTYDEIGQEYDREEYHDINQEDHQIGTLSSEADDIHRKIKSLEDRFNSIHFNIYNSIEIIFNGLFPTILSFLGIVYLYCFLINYTM